MKSKRQDTKPEKENNLSDTIRKLKSEVKRLLKQNKQYAREVQRLNGLLSNHNIEIDLPPKKEVKCENPCSRCSGKTDTIVAGIFIINVCTNCGHKERKKNDTKV